MSTANGQDPQESRVDRMERLLLATMEQTQANAQLAQTALQLTENNSRHIADLRAVVSDVREIQAEQAREFNEMVQLMRLQLVNMAQLYEQGADLQQRVSILENE